MSELDEAVARLANHATGDMPLAAVATLEPSAWRGNPTTGDLRLLLADRDAVRERIAKVREKLNRLAAWRDGPVVGPHFDDPYSAEVARECLVLLDVDTLQKTNVLSAK